jgi:hypothetical protein
MKVKPHVACVRIMSSRHLPQQRTHHAAQQTITMVNDVRARLDQLFAFDAAASLVFGVIAIGTPHGLLQKFVGTGGYNHSVHEALR